MKKGKNLIDLAAPALIWKNGLENPRLIIQILIKRSLPISKSKLHQSNPMRERERHFKAAESIYPRNFVERDVGGNSGWVSGWIEHLSFDLLHRPRPFNTALPFRAQSVSLETRKSAGHKGGPARRRRRDLTHLQPLSSNMKIWGSEENGSGNWDWSWGGRQPYLHYFHISSLLFIYFFKNEITNMSLSYLSILSYLI